MLVWSDKFETGQALIDAQHRMLISYVNRLEGVWQNTNPSREEVEQFVRFLEFLEDFVLEHFREEEDCMFRFQCPAHKDTIIAHTEFLDYFRKFKLRFEKDGYRAELVRELVDACVGFIQRHILGTDLQLKPCQMPCLVLKEVRPDASNGLGGWPERAQN